MSHSSNISRCGNIISTTTTSQVSQKPMVPSRTILRPNHQNLQTKAADAQPYLNPTLQRETNVSTGTATSPYANYIEPVQPYQISKRMYVHDNGAVEHEQNVLGSGDGEFRREPHTRQPPIIPPRSGISLSTANPLYTSRGGHDKPSDRHARPPKKDYIGTHRPAVPPRNVVTLQSLQRTNSCSSASTSPKPTRRFSSMSETIVDGNCTPSSLPLNRSLLGDHLSSSTSSLCTDDVSNAEFALITKLKFNQPLVPPRNITHQTLAHARPLPPRRRSYTHSSDKRRPPPPPPYTPSADTQEESVTPPATLQDNPPKYINVGKGNNLPKKSGKPSPYYNITIDTEVFIDKHVLSSQKVVHSSSARTSPVLDRQARQQQTPTPMTRSRSTSSISTASGSSSDSSDYIRQLAAEYSALRVH